MMEVFKILPIEKIAPCHCTGDRAIENFYWTFPDKFLEVGADWSVSLDEE